MWAFSEFKRFSLSSVGIFISILDMLFLMLIDISKTDQLRKGNEVVISVGSGEKTCPVKILRWYLTEVERYPVQSDHFVFRALSKCKSGHKLDAINRPVSYSTHCVKYLISWNLWNHDTSRHSGNRRMKRDVSWNMTCSRMFCSLHVSWWRVSKNHSVGT